MLSPSRQTENQIVTASTDQTAKLWAETEDGSWEETHQLRGHIGFARTVAYSPNGDFIVTGSGDSTLRVWREGRDGEWNSQKLDEHTYAVWSVAVSSDGKQIFSGSGDGTVRVWEQSSSGRWDSETLETENGSALTVAVSQDGSRILTGHSPLVRIWPANEGLQPAIDAMRNDPWTSEQLANEVRRLAETAELPLPDGAKPMK